MSLGNTPAAETKTQQIKVRKRSHVCSNHYIENNFVYISEHRRKAMRFEALVLGLLGRHVDFCCVAGNAATKIQVG